MGRLKASTLVEVLVAMVLIVIAVGIGSIIFMNIAQHSNNISLYKAQSIIEENEMKSVSRKSTSEVEIFRDENLVVIQKLSAIKETTNLVLVEYIATDSKNKLLMKHKKIQKAE